MISHQTYSLRFESRLASHK